MEVLISVGAKIAEYLVSPIKTCVCAAVNPQQTVEEARKEYEKLKGSYNRVNGRCEQAKSNGEEVLKEVSKWLDDAQTTLIDVEKWLKLVDDKNATTKCVHCPNNWIPAYNQGKNANKRMKEMDKLFRRGEVFSRVSRLVPAEGMQLLAEGFTVFASVRTSYNLTMRALGSDDKRIIGIFGMGGIGKTSLVKKAATSAEETQMFNRVVVAVVSQAPNIHKIQAQLGEQLCLRYSWETEIGRATQLRDRIKLEEKILVILDDVWRKIDLTEIGIPIGEHKGCKVLLTTRLEDVCMSMECDQEIKLNPLDINDSWELFKANAGTVLDGPSPELDKIARQVARECNGLPLALIVVGSALRGKSLEDWKTALRKLERSSFVDSEVVDPNQNVYERIKLSYDFLRAEVTKRCFLMCSLFPEDHEIDVGELARYALGYGMFDEDTTIDSYETAEKQVKATMNRLLDCSLLLKPHNTSECFKMHDMVRDAALWITSKRETSLGGEVFLVLIPSQSNWTKDPKVLKNASAISLLACPNNEHLPDPAQCSRLKLLLLAQSVPLQLVRDNCFEGMVALQVLDMTSLAERRLQLDLPSSLQQLQNLRTLYLRRWKLQGDISVIGKLTTLEILSLSGSKLATLPKEMAELSQLKFLDLSACIFDQGDSSFQAIISSLQSTIEVIRFPKNKMLVLEHFDDE